MKAHARYYIDERLKLDVEEIAVKMDRSASWLAEKLLRSGIEELKSEAERVKNQNTIKKA